MFRCNLGLVWVFLLTAACSRETTGLTPAQSAKLEKINEQSAGDVVADKTSDAKEVEKTTALLVPDPDSNLVGVSEAGLEKLFYLRPMVFHFRPHREASYTVAKIVKFSKSTRDD